MRRIKLLKQRREDGYGLGILCPDVKSAVWVVEIVVETLVNLREGRVAAARVRNGDRGDVTPYLYVEDTFEGLMVTEQDLTWTAKLKDILQWLAVGAMDEEIYPPEWEEIEDEREILNRDFEDPESEPSFENIVPMNGFESLEALSKELELERDYRESVW